MQKLLALYAITALIGIGAIPQMSHASTFGNQSIGSNVYEDTVFEREDALTFNSGENSAGTALMDPSGDFAYFVTLTSPGILVKIDLSTFERVGALTFPSGQVVSAEIDPAGEFGYFGSFTSPSNVYKVNLDTLTLENTITLETGENLADGTVIDPAGEFLYIGTQTSPGIIIKIDLSTFTRVGALTLNAGEDKVSANGAIIDPAGEFAYFGTHVTPGKVVKVDLSTFTRVGVVTLEASEADAFAFMMDSSGDFLYTTTNVTADRVVKIDLSTFTRVDDLTLTGDDNGYVLIRDLDDKFAYVPATFDSPGKIVRIDLDNFSLVDSLLFDSGENQPYLGALMDPDGEFAYFGTLTAPGRVVKVNVASLLPTFPQNHILASKVTLSEPANVTSVSFYSHEATGNLRLAIYDSSKDLVWESDPIVNTTAGDWVEVPIADGTPNGISRLEEGTYYLAFQTDTTEAIASLTEGSAGDGLLLEQTFGAFPASLSSAKSTDYRWSIKADFSEPSSSRGSGGILNRNGDSVDEEDDDGEDEEDPEEDEDDSSNENTETEDMKEMREMIDSLMAKIAELKQQITAGRESERACGAGFVFNRDLSAGVAGEDVLNLQRVLNCNLETRVANSGPGSPGNETFFFGTLTRNAVVRFQELHANEILTPLGLTAGTGYVGESTRKLLNK